MNDIDQLTPKQLRQAANLKERIESLQKELNGILGETTSEPAPRKGLKGKRKMSAEGRANIIAAVKARWAKVNVGKAGKSGSTATLKRKMSAAAKAKMSEAAKKRWAKAKAAGKTKL